MTADLRVFLDRLGMTADLRGFLDRLEMTSPNMTVICPQERSRPFPTLCTITIHRALAPHYPLRWGIIDGIDDIDDTFYINIKNPQKKIKTKKI